MPGVTAAAVLSHFGPDSALARREGVWPLATHVAVRTLEEIHHQGRIYLSAHGVKRSKLPKPLIIPRPGDTKPKVEPAQIKRSWVRDLIDAADIEVVTVG